MYIHIFSYNYFRLLMELPVMMREGESVLMENAVLLDVMVSWAATQRKTSAGSVEEMDLLVRLSALSSMIRISRWDTMIWP